MVGLTHGRTTASPWSVQSAWLWKLAVSQSVCIEAACSVGLPCAGEGHKAAKLRVKEEKVAGVSKVSMGRGRYAVRPD